MRPGIVLGVAFPDYKLSGYTVKRRLSDLRWR
jgi:hypothetical protein